MGLIIFLIILLIITIILIVVIASFTLPEFGKKFGVNFGKGMKNYTVEKKKYLLSGLFFSFTLATTFLPLFFEIADEHSLSFLTVIVGIVIITSLNYVYIVLLADSKWRKFNVPVLIPLDLILLHPILYLSIGLLGFFKHGGGEVFLFSLFILFFPCLFMIIIGSIVHAHFLNVSESWVEILNPKRISS
jgi:hypothetical protein